MNESEPTTINDLRKERGDEPVPWGEMPIEAAEMFLSDGAVRD